MLETWTLTPTEENPREFYDLMSMLRGSTCSVRPHEHRSGLRGVFDLILTGLTEQERQEMVERIKYVGLRRITDDERRVIAREILLPHEQAAPPADL